jgi:hypothetical protein
VFYFGNAVGETGNNGTGSGADTVVDAADEAAVRSAETGLPAPANSPYDFNRDRRINATDELIARANYRSGASALQLIDLAAAGQSAAAAATQAATGAATAAEPTAAVAASAAAAESVACDEVIVLVPSSAAAGASTEDSVPGAQGPGLRTPSPVAAAKSGNGSAAPSPPRAAVTSRQSAIAFLPPTVSKQPSPPAAPRPSPVALAHDLVLRQLAAARPKLATGPVAASVADRGRLAVVAGKRPPKAVLVFDVTQGPLGRLQTTRPKNPAAGLLGGSR